MSPRRVIGLCAILVSLLVQTTKGQEKTPIRLGHYGSMSGANAAFGEQTDQGIRLAVKQANARGGVLGRRIEVFTEDDQSNPDQILPALFALIDGRKVDVVLGEVASTLSLVGAPLCQERKVPMMTPSSVAAAITQTGDYIFRACFLDVDQGRAAALFAVRDLNARRAAILVDQKSDYAVGVARAFRQRYEALGGRIVAERDYLQGEKDFKSQLSAIRDARPDVILVPAMYHDVPGIAQQARALGLKVPLIGGDGWDSADLLRGGAADLEGAYFLTQYAPDAPDEAVRDFQSTYKAEFRGQMPDGIAALAYDATRIVLDAIRRAGSTDKTAIRDALASTRDFRGVTGRITMGPDRNPSKSARVIQIRSGAFHLATTIDPTDAEAALSLYRTVPTAGETPEIATRTSWLQPLANGLSLGAIYGLIALGYTIVYGILRLINFAHGDLFMLGPLLIFGIATTAGFQGTPAWPVTSALLTIALAMTLCGLAGLMLERVAYRPLREPYGKTAIAVTTILAPLMILGISLVLPASWADARKLGRIAAIGVGLYGVALALNRLAHRCGVRTEGRMIPLITAIGASLFLESLPQQRGLFGNREEVFPSQLISAALGGSGPLHLGPVIVDRLDLLVLGVTVALMIALYFVVRNSRMGLAMRAVSDNPEAALLMGVNVDRVIRFSFLLGGALAGAAGVLWATKYPTIEPRIGVLPGLKAFVAAVLGGIGSLPGAVLGGLILGVSEAFLAAGPLSKYKEALAFLLLIVILLVRPSGLLGRHLPEKV
ncbi:MAG: Leu/Ile/Val-binding protein [Planctomycetota bacterium]|nr:Leu/Ile/Val-binding protein [Planctomycetota bacterium]